MPLVTLPGTNRKIVTFAEDEGAHEFRALLKQARRRGVPITAPPELVDDVDAGALLARIAAASHTCTFAGCEGPHGMQAIGCLLKDMKWLHEQKLDEPFDWNTSIVLDALIEQESAPR